MSTKFSRLDKPKGKFAQSTINLVYKGNASEIQSKPTIRSSGYQVVGKLQGTRRNPPPPPWVPSIKAEMGGQDTKVNIVPPGGSGWGTGTSAANSESDAKEKVEAASILKDITENPHKEGDETKGATDGSETPLVKPPQNFRSKSTAVKPPENISNDVGRPLSSNTLAPMVPFYQRPSTTISSATKESETTDSSTEESKEEPHSVTKTVSTSRSGWAAVTTEEPDFQERINFSGDEEEPPKNPAVEVPNEPTQTAAVSDTSWVSAPLQSQVSSSKVSYPRAAWEQPQCFSSVSPMQHTYNPPYCGRNDGLFTESSLAGSHTELLATREVSLLSEQLQRTSFTSSEAQVQAQREERTLAYKSAVNRAQMARKKRNDEVIEPKRKDQSMDSVKNALTDVNVFPQSFMQSGPAALPGPPPFPLPAAVNHSPQHSVEPVFAALYSGGLPNMLHTVTPSNGFMPSQMKPQGHIPSPLSSSTWNPGSFSTNNQSPFMHPSYPLSNSPKLATNQGSYFKTDPFSINAFNPQPTSKGSGHVQSLQPDHPVDSVVHSFTNPMGESSIVNHLPFPPAKPHLAHQQSNSPILEKRMDIEANKELLNSLSRGVVMNSHPLQISAHADGTRTAFTPPTASSTIEPYPSAQNPQQSSTTQQKPTQSTSHITPLMEVDLSGKWSEKDFEVFQNSIPTRGNYIKSFKSGRGGPRHVNEDRSSSHRYGFAGSGRPNRGVPRDTTKRPVRRPIEGVEDRIDDNQPVTEPGIVDASEVPQQGDTRRQRRDVLGNGTFPRHQRSRGTNRMGRSNRGAFQDYDEDKPQNGDFEGQHQTSTFGRGDKWKTGYKSNRQGEGGAEKANSTAPVGIGRGRKNFSRSGASNRRFVDNDGASKSRGHFTNQRKHDENATTQDNVDNVDANALSDPEQGTSTLHPEDSNSQMYHSQRSQRGGGNAGRGRRGQHNGSQRQPQRRDRTDRVNNRRQNPRRHPDDDDDHDFKGAPSNNNNGTSNTTVTADSSSNANTSKGESSGSTNESSGQHQQQSGAVDSALSCGTGNSVSSGNKPRSHAHSVTLASDIEVWETASEGFSSSLVGTSPGCSLAECANSSTSTAVTVKTEDDDDDIDDAGSYLHPPKKPSQHRPMIPITGKIVPLMSINAEAPPSFCDNPSFLDSPPPPSPSPLQQQQPKNDITPGAAPVESKDVESLVDSTTASSEDGFQEVRSKSAKKQSKVRQLQKSQKSPTSSDERSSNTKPKNRDTAAKSRVQGVVSSKIEQKHSKLSKSEEKDKQQRPPIASSTTTASNQATSKTAEILTKKLSGPSKNPPPSAWLKPLQETINEKAAAAAALAARNAKTEAASTSAVAAAVSSTKSSVPTTLSSSYAWSVVVGSRTSTTTSATYTPSENVSVALATKASEKVSVSKPIQNTAVDHADTAPVTNGSKPQSNVSPVSDPHIRQSKSSEKLAHEEGAVEGLSDPSRGVSTAVASSTTSTTSANVCKVRPQKQPTSSSIAITSTASVTIAPSSRSDLTTFSVSAMQSATNNPVLVNPPQYRRPMGDVGDWIGKASSAFFDGYTCGGGKKMDNAVESPLGLNTAAAAAAAVYIQQQQQQQQHQPQQQQSFRQALPPLQHQPVMGFGLHDFTTLRHQNGRLNGPCSQNALPAESYFAASPFSAGGNGQPSSQQPPRGLYAPAPAVQQRGFPSWQPQHHPSQPPEAAVMAATANGLWSSNYTTTPPTGPHHHPPYVGVIGGDRPSSTSSVSMNSRLQPAAAAFASIYGRGGSGSAGPGAGLSPYGQPGPAPSGGVYTQSPTQQTPPPHLSFDPNFAYSGGGLAANSSSVFSHQSTGGAGGPALLAAPPQQRQPQLHSGSTRSLGDHPQAPPVFINTASHAPYPTPAAVLPQPLPTPGLHY